MPKGQNFLGYEQKKHRGSLQYSECYNVCGQSGEPSLLLSDVKRMTPIRVSAERHVEVTIIHILEAGAYRDQKWGTLPHTMLLERMRNFQCISGTRYCCYLHRSLLSYSVI